MLDSLGNNSQSAIHIRVMLKRSLNLSLIGGILSVCAGVFVTRFLEGRRRTGEVRRTGPA